MRVAVGIERAADECEADLVVVNGLGLEGWLDRLIAASGHAGPVLVVSRGVELPRVLLVHARPGKDTLWAMEQGLTSGTCSTSDQMPASRASVSDIPDG